MENTLVLLAAGDSRRFGDNKLLHVFEGKPMYRYVVDEIHGLRNDLFSKKIVVTQYDEIGVSLEKEGYEVVKNMESHLGLSHSIHLALEQAGEGNWCFIVCDQPYLKGETIEALIEGFIESQKGLGCLCCGEDLGNPAIFSQKYKDELLGLTGDVGGRRIIRKHLDDLYEFEVENGKELIDIDVQ